MRHLTTIQSSKPLLLPFAALLALGLVWSSSRAFAQPEPFARVSLAAEDESFEDDEDFDEEAFDEEEDFNEEEEWNYEEAWGEALLQLEYFGALMEKVRQATEIGSERTSAAVAAVLAVTEYAEREEAVLLLEEVLPELDPDDEGDIVVARVIRFQLAEMYRDIDQPEKAIGQLKRLILDRPLGD
ncbi:MAG: hypothetical protein AAGI46_02985 [Planctomycetota bacterium]